MNVATRPPPTGVRRAAMAENPNTAGARATVPADSYTNREYS